MNYTWTLPYRGREADWRPDFSSQALPTLDESNLSEADGISGDAARRVPVGPPPAQLVQQHGPVDWNRDGATDGDGIAADINRLVESRAGSPGQRLVGFDDWSNLNLKERGPNWADGVYVPYLGPSPDEELTADDVLELSQIGVSKPQRGDLNCDGAINFADIDGFVLALVGRTSYEADYPGCDWLNADIDGSGGVDFDDIDGFVGCLVAGACP